MPGGDPYARMAALMRTETGAGSVKMRLGTVARREPLEVVVAGLRQPKEALKINERLTKGAKWKTELTSPVENLYEESLPPAAVLGGLSGPVDGPVSCGGERCSAKLSIVTAGTLTSETLKVYRTEQKQLEIDMDIGDKVLMLTEDDQTFYILMKVVDAV